MATATSPPSPGTHHSSISSERMANIMHGDVTPLSLSQTVSATGRRSSSFDTQRRRSRNSKTRVDGTSGPIISLMEVEQPHSRPSLEITRVASAQEGPSASDNKAEGESGVDRKRASPISVGMVAHTPKEHLPPSPPLTPVGSEESLRNSVEVAENSQARVPRDKSGSVDEEVGYEEGKGDLSTWSYHPDGENTDESEAGDDSAFARPSNTVAIPQIDSPVPPTPPPKSPRKDESSAPTRYPSIFPPHVPASYMSGDLSSSSVPHNHRASASSPTRSHPLHNAPSPQPWDLVDPPPDSDDRGGDLGHGVQERQGRLRKTTSKSLLFGSRDVVVKDGKKYRIPRSSYYFGPPPDTSAFGTAPIGHMGVNHPREVVRIERDYSGGELTQFSPAYPLELEGRISPTQFLETINAINESLIEAHSLRWSFLDNTLAMLTLYISRFFVRSHYEKEMQRLCNLITGLNRQLYNPVGLNILWPKNVAFMFLEIEYY
ncbi:Golgin subfamily A member 7/ERF4 family-domain-containing protein [Phellopilus nigrolimitatus]|nr:Golgin subfamily A member 7/ERF4 family-domain-containing protein [Phellopilus nigrolimitatus]